MGKNQKQELITVKQNDKKEKKTKEKSKSK